MTSLFCVSESGFHFSGEQTRNQRQAGQQHTGSPASLGSLRELRRLGADSIAIMPFGFQRTPTDTAIVWTGNGGQWIAETDERMRAVTRQGHQLGMSPMMKPHLWLRPPEWPGSIDHNTDREWAEWFTSYRDFILHYARLSEELKIESLSIGRGRGSVADAARVSP